MIKWWWNAIVVFFGIRRRLIPNPKSPYNIQPSVCVCVWLSFWMSFECKILQVRFGRITRAVFGGGRMGKVSRKWISSLLRDSIETLNFTFGREKTMTISLAVISAISSSGFYWLESEREASGEKDIVWICGIVIRSRKRKREILWSTPEHNHQIMQIFSTFVYSLFVLYSKALRRYSFL